MLMKFEYKMNTALLNVTSHKTVSIACVIEKLKETLNEMFKQTDSHTFFCPGRANSANYNSSILRVHRFRKSIR